MGALSEAGRTLSAFLCAGITIGNIQNVMGVLYSATNFQGMFNLMNVLPVVGYERSVFYRSVITNLSSLKHFTCHKVWVRS